MNFPGNWRTTSAGLTNIGTAIIHLVFAIKKGVADEAVWTLTIGQIVVGIGLIAAGDAALSKKQVDEAKEQTKTAIETGNTDLLTKPK